MTTVTDILKKVEQRRTTKGKSYYSILLDQTGFMNTFDEKIVQGLIEGGMYEVTYEESDKTDKNGHPFKNPVKFKQVAQPASTLQKAQDMGLVKEVVDVRKTSAPMVNGDVARNASIVAQSALNASFDLVARLGDPNISVESWNEKYLKLYQENVKKLIQGE